MLQFQYLHSIYPILGIGALMVKGMTSIPIFKFTEMGKGDKEAQNINHNGNQSGGFYFYF